MRGGSACESIGGGTAAVGAGAREEPRGREERTRLQGGGSAREVNLLERLYPGNREDGRQMDGYEYFETEMSTKKQ